MLKLNGILGSVVGRRLKKRYVNSQSGWCVDHQATADLLRGFAQQEIGQCVHVVAD